jgi:Arc/MetJ family transcription regulator
MNTTHKRKTAGRITLDRAKTRRVQVMLDDDTIQKAREIGEMTYDRSEVSIGIREAIRILYAKYHQGA